MKIIIAGDFCPQKRVAIAIKKGDYSFLNDIKGIIQDSDYSIVNLEAPIVFDEKTKPILKTGPNLKCSINALRAIKQAGFNCVTLANNHFYDYGDSGVENTLCSCNTENIDYVGGGRNIEEASRTLYKTIGGKKVAIVNFCENEWAIAAKYHGGSSPLNVVHNYRQIKEAKLQADYVLVIIHGGREHYQLPRPEMQDIYHFFIETGADAIVNHHQHCYSGYEVFQGKPIFYGLGNFCFDADGACKTYWQEGYMVELSLEETIGFKLYPYTQCDVEPKIELLQNRNSFDKKIDELNAIISNKEALENNFEIWIKEYERKSYLGFIEPFVNNRYISLLWRNGLFPSLWSKKKRMILLNVIRCESHRNILIESLK